MDFKEGVILHIDKPYAMSSFGALAHIRYLLTKRMGYKVKVGHAGTLDPLATGVLTLCTGKKTKLIETLQAKDKEYVATLQLGANTASHDMEHPVDETFPTDHVTREKVEAVLSQFVGDVEQIPPVYSAVCVNGKRAYQLSRKGRDFEIKAKTNWLVVLFSHRSAEPVWARCVWRTASHWKPSPNGLTASTSQADRRLGRWQLPPERK